MSRPCQFCPKVLSSLSSHKRHMERLHPNGGEVIVTKEPKKPRKQAIKAVDKKYQNLIPMSDFDPDAMFQYAQQGNLNIDHIIKLAEQYRNGETPVKVTLEMFRIQVELGPKEKAACEFLPDDYASSLTYLQGDGSGLKKQAIEALSEINANPHRPNTQIVKVGDLSRNNHYIFTRPLSDITLNPKWLPFGGDDILTQLSIYIQGVMNFRLKAAASRIRGGTIVATGRTCFFLPLPSEEHPKRNFMIQFDPEAIVDEEDFDDMDADDESYMLIELIVVDYNGDIDRDYNGRSGERLKNAIIKQYEQIAKAIDKIKFEKDDVTDFLKRTRRI